MKSPIKYFSIGLLFLVGFLIYFYPVKTVIRVAHTAYKIIGYHHVVGNLESYQLNKCINKINCTCDLYLHGLGDNLITWLPLAYKLKSHSAVKSNIIIINTPGTGLSKRPSDKSGYSGTALAKAIFNEYNKTCQRFNLIGNSFGGYLAINIALNFPKQINSLLLLSAAGADKDYSKIKKLFKDGSLNSIKKLHQLSYAPNPPPALNFIYNALGRNFKSLPINEYLAAQDADGLSGINLASLKAIPTLILWGAFDYMLPLDHAYYLNDKIPNSELRVVNDCSHIEQKQCTNNVLDAYLYLTTNFYKSW